VIFTDPYITAQYNRWTSPQLDDDAKAIREDCALKNAISQLKLKFLQNTGNHSFQCIFTHGFVLEALIHGDLHTGSIMCTTDSTYVIDPEFAFYGPMGFDIGALIGNIFLSYFSQDGHATTSGSRDNYKKWLITLAEDVWNKFSVKFIKLWNTQHTGHVYAPSFFNDAQSLAATQQEYMKQLFQDSLGFAGAKMIR
jgi:5-methylthioribose kinase